MGVQKTVLVEGNGPSPQNGDVVTMLYTGWLKEAGKKDQKGKQFDTTEKPGRGPFKTPIGVGRVIKGTYANMPHRIHFPSHTHPCLQYTSCIPCPLDQCLLDTHSLDIDALRLIKRTEG